jgi:hypothetical protein
MKVNYCWNWLIIYAYRTGLIDRNELIRQLGNIQKLNQLLDENDGQRDIQPVR